MFQAEHVERARYYDLTDGYQRLQGQLYDANRKLALAEEQARKPATPNGNQDAIIEMALGLLEIACKRKTAEGRRLLQHSRAWSGVLDIGLSQELYRRFADCVYGAHIGAHIASEKAMKSATEQRTREAAAQRLSSKYPGMRVTALSTGRFLLTDIATGKTAGEVEDAPE